MQRSRTRYGFVLSVGELRNHFLSSGTHNSCMNVPLPCLMQTLGSIRAVMAPKIRSIKAWGSHPMGAAHPCAIHVSQAARSP